MEFNIADLQETYAAQTDEDLARPGSAVQEKENGMTPDEYFDVMTEFLKRKNLTYHQKELLHTYYKHFKIFNKSLFEKALSNLKTEFTDAEDNLLFYLNTIKSALDDN